MESKEKKQGKRKTIRHLKVKNGKGAYMVKSRKDDLK